MVIDNIDNFDIDDVFDKLETHRDETYVKTYVTQESMDAAEFIEYFLDITGTDEHVKEDMEDSLILVNDRFPATTVVMDVVCEPATTVCTFRWVRNVEAAAGEENDNVE